MDRFEKIDFENWDRREIFEKYENYVFGPSVNLDITELYHYMKASGRKFYPLFCWAVTKLVNSDRDFRIVKIDGQLGYMDRLHSCYTLRRDAQPTLFIHMVTEYDDNLDVYYERFLLDQKTAQTENRLYYYGEMRFDSVDISIVPDVSFTGLTLGMPPAFYKKDENNIRYTPFITVGRFYKKDGRVILPAGTAFHHEVNDGYHAGKYINGLQQILNSFADFPR